MEEGGITELPLAAIPGRQIPPRAPPMPASLSAANPQAAPLFAYMLMVSSQPLDVTVPNCRPLRSMFVRQR